MTDPVEITQYVARLAEGDEEAAQVIWDQYFDKLVRQARKKLNRLPRRAADEEDVALSAMNSFCRGAAAGRFPRLQGRDNLWRLLLTITARKVHRVMQRHLAQKEGGGCVLGESALAKGDGSESVGGIAEVPGKEPTPDLAAELAENCRHLLDALPNDELRAIALDRMEGYTNEEIAEKLDCSVRRVERKLHIIRSIWEQGEA